MDGPCASPGGRCGARNGSGASEATSRRPAPSAWLLAALAGCGGRPVTCARSPSAAACSPSPDVLATCLAGVSICPAAVPAPVAAAAEAPGRRCPAASAAGGPGSVASSGRPWAPAALPGAAVAAEGEGLGPCSLSGGDLASGRRLGHLPGHPALDGRSGRSSLGCAFPLAALGDRHNHIPMGDVSALRALGCTWPRGQELS
jgi:hypothetical protein